MRRLLLCSMLRNNHRDWGNHDAGDITVDPETP
jgi:hypothetical protein